MKKIVWLDDDNRIFLFEDYLSLFRQRGYELLLMDNPTVFFNNINNGAILPSEIVCFIVDMSFRSVDGFVATEGFEVGKELIKKLRSLESIRDEVKMVVYTGVETNEIKKFCHNNDIAYLQKIDYYANDFVREVIKIINKK